MAEDKKKEIDVTVIEVTEEYLKEKLYEIRGKRVLLDADLAEIYGYTNKRFNEQVRNNIEKFDSDFMFELTDDETEYLRTNFSTANISSKSRYNPHVFTEQGLYMLMTVLKGSLAVKQSKALIRTFKKMKDYILENRDLIGQRELLQLSMETANNRIEIHQPDIPTVGNIETLKSAAIIRSGNLQIDLDNSASEELLARIVRFLNAQ